MDAFTRDGGGVSFHERRDTRGAIKLRCGQCVGCRKDRTHEWAARILHESQLSKNNWFVTLTYDDVHVPEDGSLHYGHFQGFMRLLRQDIRRSARKAGAKPARIRFFVAGEYGERTARPHFHACLFNLAVSDLAYYRKSPSGHTLYKSAWLDALWGRGLCSLGAITFESAAYTAAYINKKITGEPAREKYTRVDCTTGEIHFVRPEFARMSLRPGIGSDWFDRYASDVLPRDYVIVDGHKSRVPRYYYEKFRKRDLRATAEVDFLRAEQAAAHAADSTPERLAVRHRVALAKASLSKRKL